MNTKRLGNIGEIKTIAKLVEMQIPVYQAFGDIEKADLIRRQIDETEIDLSNEHINNLLNELLFDKFKKGEKQDKKEKQLHKGGGRFSNR